MLSHDYTVHGHFRTASVFNSSEPFWGEEYNLHVPLEYQHVSVYVYDHDNLG